MQTDIVPAAEHFLYLETRGRKTGRPRRIEIWFVASDGRFYMVAESKERAGWVKNLRAHAEVAFSIGTRGDPELELPVANARARVVDATAEPALAARVVALMDAKYGWSDGLIIELTPAGTA